MSCGKRRSTRWRIPSLPNGPGNEEAATIPSSRRSKPVFNASRNCRPRLGCSRSYQSTAASASSATSARISSVGILPYLRRLLSRSVSSSREIVFAVPFRTSASRRLTSRSQAVAASASGWPSRVASRSCAKRARSGSDRLFAWLRIVSRSAATIGSTSLSRCYRFILHGANTALHPTVCRVTARVG